MRAPAESGPDGCPDSCGPLGLGCGSEDQSSGTLDRPFSSGPMPYGLSDLVIDGQGQPNVLTSGIIEIPCAHPPPKDLLGAWPEPGLCLCRPRSVGNVLAYRMAVAVGGVVHRHPGVAQCPPQMFGGVFGGVVGAIDRTCRRRVVEQRAQDRRSRRRRPLLIAGLTVLVKAIGAHSQRVPQIVGEI